MIYRLAPILILSVVLFSSGYGAGLEDLEPITEWRKLANGVWLAELGDMEGEIRYSDLAAAEPKTGRLNELSDPPAHASP